jgi:hypothetical protein
MALRSLDNLFVILNAIRELTRCQIHPVYPECNRGDQGTISQIKAINSKYISPSDKMGFFYFIAVLFYIVK